MLALPCSGPSGRAWISKLLIRDPRSTSQVRTAASWALCNLHEEMEGPGEIKVDGRDLWVLEGRRKGAAAGLDS